MKTYRGASTIDGIQVTVNDQPLDERVDIHQFTDGGFEWTYEGDAPQQLALALLSDHLDDNTQALALCRRFRPMAYGIWPFAVDFRLAA